MKETFYFSHDCNARNDSKLQKLQMKCGLEGIGCYWCIIEMLYEEGGFISVDEYERIAFELRTKYDLIREVIETYGLFMFEGGKFTSKSVLKRIEKQREKSKKARESVQARWAKSDDNQANKEEPKSERNTNVSNNDTNVILKRKEKNKENTTNVVSKKDAAKAATLERKEAFRLSLLSFADRYPTEMLKAFFEYWSELTRSETKMRYEKQETWEIAKRLATWASREKPNKPGPNNRAQSKILFPKSAEKENKLLNKLR